MLRLFSLALLLLSCVLCLDVFAADALIVFSRPGCAPCERLKALIEADPSICDGYSVTHVNTKNSANLARRYRVTSVPVVVFERDGKEVDRKVGFDGKAQLVSWLQKHGQK